MRFELTTYGLLFELVNHYITQDTPKTKHSSDFAQGEFNEDRTHNSVAEDF